jgi:uncharacterized protein (TIGR03435 family)
MVTIMVRMRLAVVIAAGLGVAILCYGQAEKFEVASVKIDPDSKTSCGDSPSGCSALGSYSGATYTARNVSLPLLVAIAWGVDSNQLSGADRLPKDRYDIEARPASGTLSYERLKPMLQALLVERFGLRTHHDMRDVSGYALVVAKGGAKLAASSGDPKPFGIYPGGLQGGPGALDTLASMLASPVGKPVVNKTGIQGNYDLKLRFAKDGDTNSSLPSIFTAIQEQLGLRLEAQKVPVDYLVIDHCELKPKEN